MKCPFCNGELVGTIGHPICRNQDCVMCDDPMPQDLLEELIRTRKALDVARHTIGWINQMIDEHTDKQAIKIKCEYAIEQITLAEQKDK